MAERTDVVFDSGGQSCAAYLYRPAEAPGSVPCVVMAHGFTGTRDDRLPAYAERFSAAGMAVLVFDYRHFGASGGVPRQLLSVRRQLDDYRAAIRYARSCAGIDPDRIGLWGSSFSGGHVLAVAAGDARIAAVVAQAPFVDGFTAMRLVPPWTLLRLLVAGLGDRLGGLLGRAPYLVAAVAEPGKRAAMTHPEAKPGFDAIVAPSSRWRNEFAARLALTIAFYRPGRHAQHLGMPVLVCVADDDHTTPPAPAVRMADRAPRGALRRYPCGHFDVYLGERFEQVVGDQVEFLRTHLVATSH